MSATKQMTGVSKPQQKDGEKIGLVSHYVPPKSDSPYLRIGVYAVLLVFLAAMLRGSWQGDDIHITYRYIDNFWNGYGLRWNVFERCQGYTHPLWMLLLLVVTPLSGSEVMAGYILSWVFSAAAVVVLVFGVAASPAVGALWLALLTSSRAFTDYSTSGLENPLTHLLVVLAAFFLFRQWGSHGRESSQFLPLAAILGLAITNRQDVLLLLAPVVGYAAWKELHLSRTPVKSVLLKGVAGVSPYLAWTAFSVVYYGFPFPNTAYSKLGNRVPLDERIARAWDYIWYMTHFDPLGLALLVVAGLLCLSRDVRTRLLGAGVGLYLAYLLYIGGDFMAGRFFTAPMILLAAGASRYAFSGGKALAGSAAVLALGLVVTPYHPLLRQADFHRQTVEALKTHGIFDEAGFYFQDNSILTWRTATREHYRDWRIFTERLKRDGTRFYVFPRPGLPAYIVGPEVVVLDLIGLPDPYLARIPAMESDPWRPGHFRRALPRGYVETLQTGQNRIQDASMAEYYDRLAVVTQGPLFTVERFQHILGFALGSYDHLIDRERFIDPFRTTIEARELPPIAKRHWADLTNVPFRGEGLTVEFGGLVQAPCIVVNISGNPPKYAARILREGEPIWTWEIDTDDADYFSTVVKTLNVPPEVGEAGFDVLHLTAFRGTPGASLGGLTFAPQLCPDGVAGEAP